MKTENWESRELIFPLLDPKLFPPERLFYWLALPRNPVFASPDPVAKMFIAAMLKGKKAQFVYVGGSTPGLPRIITPSLVFRHEPEGRIYVVGYCHIRAATRVFALDKAMVIWSRN